MSVRAIVVAAIIGSAILPSFADSSADSLRRRLASVTTLVDDSSGARQVQRVAAPPALARQATARSLLHQAALRIERGDLKGAGESLDQASREMFAAIRQSAPQEVAAQKDGKDFDLRMDSARALHDALLRVAKEKGANAEFGATATHIGSLLAQAAKLRDSHPLLARQRLDEAYLLAKASVAGLRGGDTLVRSLHFETKADEYAYEVDRNDTHRMLIDVLLTEKRESKGIDRMVTQYLAEADGLRAQAEVGAGRRDFDEGVRLLEQSTRALVRAIRSAGIYIPG